MRNVNEQRKEEVKSQYDGFILTMRNVNSFLLKTSKVLMSVLY